MSSKLLIHLEEIRQLPEITLDKLADGLKDQALLVLCLISILPFMQPIPLPGVSTVLGLIALLQGIALMFLKKPILTKKMKVIKISHERFDQIVKAAEKFVCYANKLSIYSHPWVSTRACKILCGAAIVFSSSFLSLPLPIPLSNFVPALSIAFICLGLLEEDLILVLTGLSISFAVIWMAIFSYNLVMEMFPGFL